MTDEHDNQTEPVPQVGAKIVMKVGPAGAQPAPEQEDKEQQDG